MARKSKIKLSRFTYPNGTRSWRVSGSVDGKQVRKTFLSKEEAEGYKQELEIKLLNGPENGRHMWVKITPEEHDDAFAALRLLKEEKSPRSLVYVVQHFLETHKEVDESTKLGDAANQYIDAREKDCNSGALRETTFRKQTNTIKRFSKEIGPEVPIGRVDHRVVETFLAGMAGGAPKPKSWNLVRGELSHFFKWALSQDMIAEDPILKVEIKKTTNNKGLISTLSAADAAELMAWLEENPKSNPGVLVPFFALALFTGIRPQGEISRLTQDLINTRNGILHITQQVSKTGFPRRPYIQPNLALWLERYPPSNPIIAPRDSKLYLKPLKERFSLEHDVLRHTYISMLVGSFRSIGDAALQAGNSEAVIKNHYLDLKTVEEADAFWRIVPKGMSLPPLEKDGHESRFVIGN